MIPFPCPMAIDYQFNPNIVETNIGFDNENSTKRKIESNHKTNREEEKGR
jgi:hypothetical protein